MTVDDEVTLVGSANLNDRSMLTDTETAIAWHEPAAVRDFRLALWQHALGIDTSKWCDRYVERWSAQAQHNASVSASQRTGFVMPLPRSAEDVYAKPSILIPSELV